MQNCFSKIRNIILTKINVLPLEKRAGFQAGAKTVRTSETIITARGPHLIFDLLGIAPAPFYNVDKKREKECMRSLRSQGPRRRKRRRARIERELNGTG